MKHTTRVNLHSHSSYSDGEFSPEILAEKLAAAGVEFAALTDHDSVEGQLRFHRVLEKYNIGFLSGVEITTYFNGREMHLLAYGFDIHHAELKATLQFLRHERLSRIQGPLRRLPSQHLPEAEGQPAPGVTETGKIGIEAAINLVHSAGGKAFLAHPWVYESDLEPFTRLIVDLKSLGLDGIEASCGIDSDPENVRLCDIAIANGLVICSGTDFHGQNGPDKSQLAVDIATESWKRFVKSITASPYQNSENIANTDADQASFDLDDLNRPGSFLRPRIVLPSVITILLFIATIWGMILPSIEEMLIDRKRDMIRELTNTALSLLAAAEREERSGRLTRAEAQEKAMAYIGALRYGSDGKDYFWIQDMQPLMIMHPYRPDLNGQDVSGFTDPRGIRIFVEFAKIVRRHQKGFVEYVWQWKDDPGRLVAKESYVRGFEPWGWVIGTGIYIDDVMLEIRRVEKKVVYTLSAILALVFLVLLINVRQSLNDEKKKLDMQARLLETERRYRSLIEAATEGTLLVLNGRCRYGNPILLQMIGYSAERLELLELSDLLPQNNENADIWSHIERLPVEGSGSKSFEAVLTCSRGERRECLVTLNPIVFADQPGIIALIKDAYPVRLEAESIRKLGQAAQSAAIGIFQAKTDRLGGVVVLNSAARMLFKHLRTADEDQFALSDLFDLDREYEETIKNIRKNGRVSDQRIQKITVDGQALMLSLCADLVSGENGEPALINCVVRDITESIRREKEQESFIERLGVSLLFLQERIGRLGVPVLCCNLQTPIHRAAAMMSTRNTTCIVVETDQGEPVGFVTDHDFRRRLVGNRTADHDAPVRTIMSAPLITISEQAMIYEALMLMEENQIQHLAIRNDNGSIGNVVRAMELLQFHRYGPVVLLREIARAQNADQVSRCCERLPLIVKALVDAGARPRIVAQMTSKVCDATAVKLIELAIEEIGPPPVPFAFIAMGSQGRQEQTLLTDQDNAIIYEFQEATDRSATADYFLRLGTLVCRWFNDAGYPFCDGNVMASNPKWCQSLPEWKENFSEWILRAEPKELLDFSICLDFRTVYGAADLTDQLRAYLYEVLKDRPSFLPHLAQNALLFKPPLRLMGRIIKSGGPREEAGQLNIKEIMMPLVSFGRIYALQHKMTQTHTMERIETLAWKGILQPSAYDAVSASYNFLMRLRFQAQLMKLEDNRRIDNCIALDKIGHMDEAMIKQAFTQIESLQKKIIYDFLGGAEWPGN